MYENQKCIIRTNRAGVFFANVKEYDKVTRDIILTDCRRLWYWDGACSLSQLAIDGTCNPSACKFSIKVPEMAVMEVVEIIPCNEKAIKSIEGVREWKR